MAFQKGKARTGGRQKGMPNKCTQNAREAIALFIEGNVHRLTEWLDRIAENDPKAAFDCFVSILEFNIPKMQRSQIDITKNDPLADVPASTIAMMIQSLKESIEREGLIASQPNGHLAYQPAAVIDNAPIYGQ